MRKHFQGYLSHHIELEKSFIEIMKKVVLVPYDQYRKLLQNRTIETDPPLENNLPQQKSPLKKDPPMKNGPL